MQIVIQQVELGKRYRISGDLSNGRCPDGTPYISHDDVVRKILRVSQTHVICECGRRFLINNNLIIETFG